MKNTQKGFTLIELLVVIAIIGILATIVLTSLGSARAKADDAKVQEELSNMRAQGELFYTSTAHYGVSQSPYGNCSSFGSAGALFNAGTNTLGVLLNAIQSAGYTPYCYEVPANGTADATAWAVVAVNSAGTEAWCADSSGQSKAYVPTTGSTPPTVAPSPSTALCP